jgi:hypothetical protein
MAESVDQFTFANGDVIVSIPSTTAPRLKAVDLGIGAVELHPASGFQPIRVVTNVAIEEEGKPGVYLSSLGRTVKLKIKYRAADLKAAGSKPLVLAFWDGSKWVPFTSAKHGFKLTAYADPAKGGYGMISIKKWGDPPISWGT